MVAAMPDNRFPICTPEVPTMLGRTQIIDRIIRELTKTSPSHRSIVGPRFIGKSVILAEVARRMRKDDSPYCAVIEWDLGHLTPQSDDEFLRALCAKLGQGLVDASQTEYGEYLIQDVKSDFHQEIANVMDSITDADLRVLMIWDGFDKPLSTGTLTRNLWDNLRELCLKDGFRLITATRRELHELIRDEKSVTSDFWNIFGDIVRVPPMGTDDLDAILDGLSVYNFESGAKTELMNWSGGNPPLVLSILNAVCEACPSGSVTNADVNKAAEAACSHLAPILTSLWSDCSTPAQDLYASLIDVRELPVAETNHAERTQLEEKGFAKATGTKVRPSCKLMEAIASGGKPDAGSMGRLFGEWDRYQANIRALLERRLAQIPNFDQRLIRLVARAVEDIPEYPDDCLNNLTGIRDRALSIIWEREFCGQPILPSDLIAYWSRVGQGDRKCWWWITNRLDRTKPEFDSWTLPTQSDAAIRVGLIQVLTGCSQGFEPRAKTVGKDTYVLLNTVHNFRNRGEHGDGQAMHVGVAVAAMMTCVELVGCLAREGACSND